MTVIAWDGRFFAADKRATEHGSHKTVRKLFKLENGDAAASCGNSGYGRQLIAWYQDGANPFRYHPLPTADHFARLIIVTKERRVFIYEDGPIPFEVLDKMVAEGSGRDSAKAAMLCGKNAIEAIAITSMIDVDCGNGCDYVDFAECEHEEACA